MTPAATSPVPGRTVVAAALLLALVASSWLIWTRAEPARQGGFCMNATVELARVLQGASAASDPGLGLVPDPAAILEASAGVDLDRLGVRTPPSVQPHLAVLQAAQPAHLAERAAAAAEGRPAPPVPAEVASAFTAILIEYLEICR